MFNNQFWSGRVLVCSPCQFLWCKYSNFKLPTWCQLTDKIPENWTVSFCKSVQTCYSIPLYIPLMCMCFKSSLRVHGTVYLKTLLLLSVAAKISDIFPHLPLHLFFPSPVSQVFFKLFTFSLLPLRVLILCMPSSHGKLRWYVSFTPCHSLCDNWNWGWARNSKLGIKDSTVATGTVQL